MSGEVVVADAREPRVRELSDAERHHRDVVIRLQEAVFGAEDFAGSAHLFTDDFIDHNPVVPGGDLAG